MSMSDSASQSSYSTGASGSVADTADARQLDSLAEGEDAIASDLVEQNRSIEDAVFASLFTLSKNRKADDLRWTIARIVLEFLQMFRVVFNTVFAWKINTDLWVWKAFYWLLFRLVVLPMGYDSYIAVLYVLGGVVLAALALTVWVAVVLKKDETGSVWLKRLVYVLQAVALVVFSVFWVAILDYVSFLFNCHWSEVRAPRGAVHLVFAEHNCLAMPHLAHMVFGLVLLLLFCFATLCMSISDCDLNPLTRNQLASPVAVTSIKTMALKMAMVLVSTTCTELGAAQSILMLAAAAVITYYLLTTTPYYYDLVNATWVGLWCAITFTTVMLVVLDYTIGRVAAEALEEYRAQLTLSVLYGIFPAVLLGAALTWAVLAYKRRPLAKLAAASAQGETGLSLKDVHRFQGPVQAEFLLRVMRRWDEDGIPDPDTTAFGEFILRCAMARLPNAPYLLTLYAGFIIEVRKDGQAARTQLQLASKASPTLLERYFVYAAHEAAKKLKNESEGLDLISYVEFQRSYRACVRAHKMALQAQRQFWHSMLRDTVAFKDLQAAFEAMDRSEKAATAVYRRVLERYPTNGKLLKIYGRFLEFVRNDPWGGSRFYAEAMKQGTSESLLSLAGSSADGDTASKLTSLLGSVDEKADGIVIINAAGLIMMVNAAASRMFGYERGDLDGKNVATLMPQPFSTRHNSFVQRCANTGQARILGSLRHVVALHKDRAVFPVSMVIQKLSGLGPESIFMAVLRPTASADPSLVKVWVTPGGVVLCADERFRDWFGITGRDMVGRSLSSLATDIEGFDRFIAACSELPRHVVAGSHRLRTRLIHKYLAPVEAEASIEFGGSDDQVILVVNLRCMSDSLSLLVTDAKGRIHFATNQLAASLGYDAKAMSDGMNLASLLPPPYSQVHAGLMKDLPAKPPPGSCRAGAVVHLLHANNSKVPVTLTLTQHDDGEHMQHVIKVTPASEAALLDQQRLELSLNHKGVVLGVNQGASKAVFGFNPKDLVGRPLASFLNLFDQWRTKFGEDESLLVMLGMRAEQAHAATLRVGVHNPYSDADMQARARKASGSGADTGSGNGANSHSLLGALQSRHKDRAAVMTLSLLAASEEAESSTAGAAAGGGAAPHAGQDIAATPVLSLSLWRADGMSSVLELDGKLSITRAEPGAGLMFGVAHTALLHKSFKGLVGLPSSTTGGDLLSASGKKSQLKEGAAWKMGPVRSMDARHMDAAPLKLTMQAVSKDGKSSSRLLVLLRLSEPGTGSLQPLLAMRAAAASGEAGAAAAGLLSKQASDSDSEEAASDDGGRPTHGKGGRDSPELHERLDSRLRTQQWLSSSFRKGEAPGPGEGNDCQQSPRGSSPARGGRMRASGGDEDGAAFVSIRLPPGASKPGCSTGPGGKAAYAPGDDAASGGDAASEGGGSAVSGSQSAGGSEALDASSAVGSEVEDELVADWRRAKRLKKLNRMMNSSLAQVAAERFRRHTYALTAIICAAHVVCFVVLMTQVNARYETAYEVGDMAQATERSQMVVMRSNFIQKCGRPDFRESFGVCDPQRVASYVDMMTDNYNVLRNIHQGLYLGYTKLKQFRDPRLMEYWTFSKLPESTWFLQTADATHVYVDGNTSLWEMGNKYLQASLEVQFNARALGYGLVDTPAFHYIYDNGPHSLFEGYTWSLDVFVDYAYAQLGALNNVLVVLLIVEALLVQLVTMSYEFVLLKAANSEAMKRFSVFLALPSATIRGMASRQLAVDDDDGSDLDDDELEAINATAGQATEAGQEAGAGAATTKDGEAAGKAAGKSVRMSVAAGTEDDAARSSPKRSGKGTKGKSAAGTSAARKAPKSGWAVARKRLFGWLGTATCKVNGKKLLPYNAVLWRFMVPLLAWVAAVIIIFGVSFQKLTGLQGPLASLNAAAHVRFRFARTRMVANTFGFAETPAEVEAFRVELKQELASFKSEYESLLYGGPIGTKADDLHFDSNAPAAAFANAAFADIFFKTKACLRADQSGCHAPGSPWHDVTHSGLDAMVTRFIQEITVFANLPQELAFPNHTAYEFVAAVAATDMYEGLEQAAHLFVSYTIARFEEVKQLHIILLACTLVLILAFVAKLFRPYVARLHAESKAIAGMMSQLPAEVDIESHVKALVLGLARTSVNSMRQGSLGPGSLGGPGPSLPGGMGMGMAPYGRGGSVPGMMGGMPGTQGFFAGSAPGNPAALMALPGPGGYGRSGYGPQPGAPDMEAGQRWD